MGIVEDRTQPQVYFCLTCGGPGTCVHKATGKRYCVKCATKLPVVVKTSKTRTEKHRRPRATGFCWICGQWDNVTKHHSKPLIEGHKKEGPIWLLCCGCHSTLHRTFRNKVLRQLSLEDVKRALRETRFGIGT